MPFGRDAAYLSIIQEGMWTVFSPFASIGMLLLALGNREEMLPILLLGIFCGIVFSLLGYIYEEIYIHGEQPKSVPDTYEFVTVATTEDKDVSIQQDNTEESHIALSCEEASPSGSNQTQSRLIRCYENIMQYWPFSYNLSCSLLINSFIYMIANHFPWNASFTSHIVLSAMLGLTSAFSILGSMFLPTAVRNWLGVGSCLCSLTGTTIWMLGAPPYNVSIGTRNKGLFENMQVLTYIIFILYGIAAFKRPTNTSFRQARMWKWIVETISLCTSIIISTLPGLVRESNPSFNFISILASAPRASNAIAIPARICCILGLIGANIAVLTNLYKPYRLRREDCKQIAKKHSFAILPSIIIMFTNIFGSAILPEIVHYMALLVGGVLAPFINTALPYVRDRKRRDICAYTSYGCRFTLACVFIIIAGFGLSGRRASLRVPMDITFGEASAR